jgi:Family of unknown function (DUF5681)
MAFSKGQSGNPAGKPPGARHRATMAAEALLDGEVQALTRKAIERALEGDGVALRLCLERCRRGRADRNRTRPAGPAAEASLESKPRVVLSLEASGRHHIDESCLRKAAPMSATTGSFSVGNSTVQMPVRAGTLGPSVVDISKLYAQPPPGSQRVRGTRRLFLPKGSCKTTSKRSSMLFLPPRATAI